MAKGIMERLAEGVVLGDGGYIQELGKRGVVQEGPYTPEVCMRYPEAVKELHWEFLNCGSEVLQAMAFYGSRSHLEYVGLGDRVRDVNRAAVRLAREVAGDQALVSGNLSTTWRYDADDKDGHKEIRQQFDEQLEEQVDEGVDFVIAEFIFDLGEALIALESIKSTGLPAMVTLTFERHLRTRDGFTPAQCARKLVAEGADIVGTNCGRGPVTILPVVRHMANAVDVPIAVQPSAYRTGRKYATFFEYPGFPDAMEPMIGTRFDMADSARAAVEMGASYIGGCCSTGPAMIRQMGRAVGKVPEADRSWGLDYERPTSITEHYKHTPGIRQD